MDVHLWRSNPEANTRCVHGGWIVKRIYVSYRRQDTSESYGRIVERLTGYFGSEAVLRTDTSYALRDQGESSVSPQDYRAYVAAQMKNCAAMLLIIGPHWLASPVVDGWSITSPSDPARIEVEEALRAGVAVVPVLVQQATMPREDQLPPSVGLLLQQDERRDHRRAQESLLALVSQSGVAVRRDPDFGGDVQRLCEIIENLARLEASNPQRAASLVGRTLRNAILIGGGALLAHAGLLAYLAYQFALPAPARFSMNPTWFSGIIVTGLIDWGIYFLLGYFTSRRTGDAGLAIIASVGSYLIGIIGGLLLFADLAWVNWLRLEPTTSQAVPALLDGAPGWVVYPILFLMRPFILTFVTLALGTPIGLAASVGMGLLGGSWGSDIGESLATRAAERQRRALLRTEPSGVAAGGSRDRRPQLFNRRAKNMPGLKRGAVVGKVFISYRRDDSAVMCGAIYDRLTQAFGVEAVFKDVDMIPVGVNFERFISTTLEQCVAQIVVIGPRWVSIQSGTGERRLDDPKDFVRLEVEFALRDGLAVIPVLAQGAKLPAADDLPESLRPLAELAPSVVRYAPEFDEDMRQLTQRLAPTMWPSEQRRQLLKRMMSVRVGLAATQVAATWWLALFTALGSLAGLATYHIFLQQYKTPPVQIINFLAAAPAIAPLFMLIGGVHLAFTSGKMRRSLWLIMRAAMAGVISFALISQIYGLVSHHGDIVAATHDRFFVYVAVGAPAIGLAMLLGPLLFIALISTSLAALARRLIGYQRWWRTPKRVAMLYRQEDAVTATQITQSLSAYFGRGVFVARWWQTLARLGWHGARRAAQSIAQSSLWTRSVGRLRRAVTQTAWLRPLARIAPRRAPLTLAERTARSLRGSAIVLALVGTEWTASDGALSDFENPDDSLRLSIETALGLNIPVVPTLLTGATMPSPDQLPASMREFAMLNGAWVRNPPDYDGDTRRLTRVIERLTVLRQAKRVRDTALPAIIGSLLSALALVVVDVIGALFVARAMAQAGAQTQTSEITIAAVVVGIDTVIYALTGALVTRQSNRRMLGVLTGLLGSALGAAASIAALRLAPVQMHSAFAQVTGNGSLYGQFATLALIFVAVRMLLSIVGAVIAGMLGSLYGRVTYQARERRAQERRLHAMVRLAVESEPLSELSARSVAGGGVRRTHPIASTGAVAQDTALAATASVGASVAAAATDTPATSGDSASEGPAPDDDDAASRDRLFAEMLQSRARARQQSRVRLLVVASVVAAVGLVALGAGGAIYHSQTSDVSAQSTISAKRANQAAVETAIEYARPVAYSAVMPAACEKTGTEGTWTSETPKSMQVNCEPDVSAAAISATPKNTLPSVIRLTLHHRITSAYTVGVDLSFIQYGTCGGLVTGRNKANTRYFFELCDNGQWRVFSQAGGGAPKSLRQNVVGLLATDRLVVIVSKQQYTFYVNGRKLSVITVPGAASASDDYLGLYIRSGTSPGPSAIAAEFGNFSYQPKT